MTTAIGTELIEGYLRTRQVQYFRGHHDDEFFFLVSTYHGRLHVHLQPCGPAAKSVKISVTAERYYPIDQRERVAALAEQWNSTDPRAGALVFESSDPGLVGVVAESRFRTGDIEFGVFADQTIQSAVELFGRMKASVGSAAGGGRLLDAG